MVTVHFKADHEGWWSDDDGHRICQWNFDSEQRVFEIRCGEQGKRIDLPSTLMIDRSRLARLAIECAEQILGKQFDF